MLIKAFTVDFDSQLPHFVNDSKMRGLILLLLAAAASADLPTQSKDPRIIGGQLTTINNYPFMTVVLKRRANNAYTHECGGSILNQLSVLSAAHCFHFDRNPALYRMRVGSSFASSQGVVHNTAQIIFHPNYVPFLVNADIAILRSQTQIQYTAVVQPVSIAGENYNVADNQRVWAAGWGWTEFGSLSEQLRHVQVYTINQEICRQRYINLININPSMLCAGILNVGGRDQCGGDSGGPLLHDSPQGRVLVGVCSFGEGCAHPYYPGVNARVSYVSNWIQNNT